MADYKKMYAIMCGAVDDVIDTLEQIPLALSSAETLRKALTQAEEVFIETTAYVENNDGDILIKMDAAWDDLGENDAT